MKQNKIKKKIYKDIKKYKELMFKLSVDDVKPFHQKLTCMKNPISRSNPFQLLVFVKKKKERDVSVLWTGRCKFFF